MPTENDLRLPIGQFALVTGLSPRMLRDYDEKGLLTPKRDPINNYRYYTRDQIETGLRIKVLGWMGFGCAEIDRLLSQLEDRPANAELIEAIFRKRLAETQVETQRLKKVEEVLKGRMALEVLSMTVSEPTIKTIPEMRAVCKRARGELPELIISLVHGILGQITSPSNQRGDVSIVSPPMTIYHDPAADLDMKSADIEIAFPVTGRISVDPGYEVKTFPAHRVVSVFNTGPYSECEGAYAKAMDYVGRNGLAVVGPFREIYLNSPDEVPESGLLTEIQIPIR